MIYLTSSDIYALINYTGFATWVSIGLAVFCIPWLRWKQPDWERPIKVNLIFPIVYILCTIFITVGPHDHYPKGDSYWTWHHRHCNPCLLYFHCLEKQTPSHPEYGQWDD